MRRRRLGLGILGGAALCALLGTSLEGAPGERGLRVVRSFGPDQFGARAGCTSVTVNRRGLIYAGNLEGVLEYDGSSWRLIPVANRTIAWDVDVDSHDRVVVAAMEELGLLEPDARGLLHYRSLLPLVPAEAKPLGDVLAVHAAGDSVVFRTGSRLLVFHDDAMRLLPEEVRGSFRVGDEVWADTPSGLRRFDGTGLEPAVGPSGGPALPIEALARLADGRLVASVAGRGLVVRDGARQTPFGPHAALVTAAGPRHATLLPDGRLALATTRAGILVFDSAGRLDERFDTSSGLPFDVVRHLLATPDGTLWATLEAGIARIDASSPLSILDARSGLDGIVLSTARHSGRLYAGTTAGLYAFSPSANPEAIPRATRIAGVAARAFDLLSLDDGGLLVATTEGIFRVQGGKALPVPGTGALAAYALAREAGGGARVWVGLRDGLGVLSPGPAGLSFQGRVPGISTMVRSIEEPRRGTLWLGTITSGAIRVEVGSDLEGASVHPVAGGSPEVTSTTVGGRLVLASERGAFRPVGSSSRIEPDPALSALPSTSFLREDAAGNLWLGKRPPVVAWRQPDGTYRLDPDALSDAPGSDVQAFFAEPDGVVWIGTDGGLLRWESRLPHEVHGPPPALIRRVTARDRVLYGGAGPPGATGEVVLAHHLNSFRFEWAGGGTHGPLLFQMRLEGEDEAFSDWSTATSRELSGLGAGRYVFRVRARTRSGVAGPEATFSFRVRPPPWRSPVALFAWAVLAVTATWGAAQLRSRALRLRNRELAARIEERTRQLEVAQGAAEDANRSLAKANARLEALSYLDGLTGAANRRRFDESLEAEWQRSAAREGPLSLVLVDLDLFRQLNDVHGSQAGDDVLRRVAGLAREAAREPAHLVARIGGAQFAILLPGTGAEGARTLAGTLREAIALREHGDSLPPATASLGVATALPRTGGRASDLLSASDGALQRARALGGNRFQEAT